MFKQVFYVVLATAAMGCSQGSNAPRVRVSAPRGQWQGFPALPIPADGAQAEQLAKAQVFMQQGDADGAIQALEELVQKDPKNRYALLVLAQALQDRGFAFAHGRDAKTGYGMFQRSARYMRQLKAAVPELSATEVQLYALALYNDACADALYGSKDKALSTLEEAVKAGFDKLDEIAKDEDFKQLREEPRFKAILEGLRPM